MKAIGPSLLGALLLSGCASTTQVIERTTTVPAEGEAHSLLLVAQTPEDSLSETWELVCRPIFQKRGLKVVLGHQELPLWQNKGDTTLFRWARQHHIDRVLIVNLTQLLIEPPHMPERQDLNLLGQRSKPQPTFHIGIGGHYQETPPPPREQSFPVDLFNAEGGNLWHGLARTHEANDSAAIAQSQCTALRDTFAKQGLIP